MITKTLMRLGVERRGIFIFGSWNVNQSLESFRPVSTFHLLSRMISSLGFCLDRRGVVGTGGHGAVAVSHFPILFPPFLMEVPEGVPG